MRRPLGLAGALLFAGVSVAGIAGANSAAAAPVAAAPVAAAPVAGHQMAAAHVVRATGTAKASGAAKASGTAKASGAVKSVKSGLSAAKSAASSKLSVGVPNIPGIPDVLGCSPSAPTPEVPGRGVVGFFEADPKTPPAPGDPFAPHSTTSIYEQYGYAGLRWNTYDLGCGPDLARSPDAAIGTAVANWIITLPKTAVAATGAVLTAAFQPDFLGVFDPLISNVVNTLRHAIFEQWAFVVLAALGTLVIWRARRASLASTAGAIGWALLVMVLVTMVFRWPLVAGHAADETVTTTLGAVTGGLNDKAPGAASDAGTEATAGMHEALLYQAWLGGTFGDANSDVAKKYGPVIFDATALTWSQAATMKADPAAGQEIIKAKEKKFQDAAAKVKTEDPDAYEYLTGRRSDSRVGYAVLAGLATLCAVPFLFVAGLLVLGALIIVRFGVMLFPAFATLGLFPTMRTLVTGIGSTVAAALINAIVFGIGAAVTVLGMGVLLSPTTGAPPWLEVILMLLLTIVMWVALRPFRRLTQMVSSRHNHFATASGGVSSVTRSAARTSGRILTSAVGTFLGVSAAQRHQVELEQDPAVAGVPQRSENTTTYDQPGGIPAEGAPAVVTAGAGGTGRIPLLTKGAAPAEAAGAAPLQPASLTGALQINADSVTVIGGRTESIPGSGSGAVPEVPGEIYAPAARAGGSRSEAASGGSWSGAVASGGAMVLGAAAGGGSSRADDDASGGRFESGGTNDAAGGSRGSRENSSRRQANPAPREVFYDGTPATDGAPIREKPTDRGFQRSEAERAADHIDLDELNEVFRPAPVRQQ